LGHETRPRRAARKTIGTAAAIISLSVAAGASAGGGGGITPSDSPKLDGVRCTSSCAGTRKATAGSKVELTGEGLRQVRKVSFAREGGGRVEVAPTDAAGRSVKAKVPAEAATGKPKVTDRVGNGDTSPERLQIVAAGEIPDDGGFELRQANASPSKAFFYAKRDASLRYSFEGEPLDVRVLVTRRKSDKVVRTLVQHNREPFVENEVRWNGRNEQGDPVEGGEFRFKVGPKSGGSVDSSEDAKFGYYGHKFPVRGPHQYWDGFGAGRGHQGTDVGAGCGTPVAAARGGQVQWKRYHSAAGYYLVIDGKGTGRDYAYMHLRRKGRPREGARVRTGERIGRVSDTGNASGCHLHFEIWSAPGWYEGGHATDSEDDLRAWDRYS
jgi:murein DD-endopeptidase MepM/ murein hydrolase activator NlpD